MFSDSSGPTLADHPTPEALQAIEAEWVARYGQPRQLAQFFANAEWHDLIAGEGVAAASPAGPRHQNPHRKFPRIYTYEGRHREAEA